MNAVKQRKVAAAILAMLDPRKQRKSLRCVVLLQILAFLILMWAARSASPLAIMPQTAAALTLGYLIFYLQSLRLYPHIGKYFDLAALERDARGVPPPVPGQTPATWPPRRHL